MKQIKKIALLFIAAITLQACYPGDSIPIADLDTTSTFYEPNDFVSPHTSAAILWDVVEVIDEDDPDNNIPYNGEVDSEMLNTTLDNISTLYGETNITIIVEVDGNGNLVGDIPIPSGFNGTVIKHWKDDPNPPAAPVVEALYTASIMLKEQTVAYYYPGYPWYGGGWGCWYCSPCYYCGYPPTVGYQSYEVGSVIIELINVSEIEAGPIDPNDTPISWIAVNRGLLSSDKKFNAQRTEDGINQSFKQSPYLTK